MPDFLKATAAVNLIQLQAHSSPDRLLPLQQYNQADLQFAFDLTDQVGYTVAMAAQHTGPQLRFRREEDGVMRLASNPPPGTPPEAVRLLQQVARALTPSNESEHGMTQMPLNRRPTKADAQKLMAEGARILNEIDELRGRFLDGSEPTDDGAVITFQRAFLQDLGNFYSYAAMRANGKWYLTGSMGSIAFTYDELLYWCEEGDTRDFHLITDNAFQPALPAPVADAVSDDMADRLSAQGVTVTADEPFRVVPTADTKA